MKTSNIASLLMENCKTISVYFKEDTDKKYVFKTTEILNKGDLVVVKTKGCYKLAKVYEAHIVPQIDLNSTNCYEWIVSKVDTTQYEELNALEKEFSDHLLQLEQRSVRANAMLMLTEELGIKSNILTKAINKLNGV